MARRVGIASLRMVEQEKLEIAFQRFKQPGIFFRAVVVYNATILWYDLAAVRMFLFGLGKEENGSKYSGQIG